jgi:hypothetical protein
MFGKETPPGYDVALALIFHRLRWLRSSVDLF